MDTGAVMTTNSKQIQTREVRVSRAPVVKEKTLTERVRRIARENQEAKDLLASVLASFNPENRMCPEDFQERIERFLKIERRPATDATRLVRAAYAKADKLLLEDLYAIAARSLVSPSQVDAAVKELGGGIRQSANGRVVTLDLDASVAPVSMRTSKGADRAA